MRFQKGMPRHASSGRKVGTTNKKRLAKASDLVAEAGLNPISEILKLIPELDVKAQVDAWFDILSYCQAKPKDEGPSDDDNDDDLLEKFKNISNETLLTIVRNEKEVS